jgi:hypothetical protein
MSEMRELARRIDAHLKRFEADPAINVKGSLYGTRRFYGAHCSYYRGNRISVSYVAYQGTSSMTKMEAKTYLEMLDAGFVGRHFEALREASARVIEPEGRVPAGPRAKPEEHGPDRDAPKDEQGQTK